MRIFLSVSASLSSALSLIGAAAAFAGDNGGLEEIVVTATRSEQPVSKIGNSVTVLSAQDVQNSQKTVLSDLLSGTPGVTVTRNGGLGQTTFLRIRGAETDQTVVLFDGVKLNDPSSPGGGYDFANLVTNDFARIEILRGPQSTLWGSQAIGGVVNIITPEPKGPLAGAISAEGGQLGSGMARARLEAGGERFDWRIGGSYLSSKGVSAFDKTLGGTEPDGFRNIGFNTRATYKFSDAVSADFRSIWSKSRFDFDGYPPPLYNFADTNEYGRVEELVTYAGLNVAAFEGRWKNRIGFSFTNTDRHDYNPGSGILEEFNAVGRNRRFEYQGTLSLAPGYQAVLGLESERSGFRTAAPSEFDPNPVPLIASTRLDSVYAELQASPLSALALTLGMRHDDHATFGGHTTGRAALAWSLRPDTILRASFGDGFKAPTLYQLFSPYGNEALRPEEAAGWDAGIEQKLAAGRIDLTATYFSRNTRNMIDFVSCFGGSDPRCIAQPYGFYDNVQKTSARGVELSAVAHAGDRVQLSFNYTRTDAKNDTQDSPNVGLELARRARDTANAGVTYEWPIALTTAVSAQYVGPTFDDAANTVRLSSYTLLDFRAAYAYSKTTSVYARVENALDKTYETTGGYGTIGRTLSAGIRTSF
jgi:vitamin B12 transporter